MEKIILFSFLVINSTLISIGIDVGKAGTDWGLIEPKFRNILVVLITLRSLGCLAQSAPALHTSLVL